MDPAALIQAGMWKVVCWPSTRLNTLSNPSETFVTYKTYKGCDLLLTTVFKVTSGFGAVMEQTVVSNTNPDGHYG